MFTSLIYTNKEEGEEIKAKKEKKKQTADKILITGFNMDELLDQLLNFWTDNIVN